MSSIIKPKKKSTFDYVIPAVLLGIIIFLSLHLAMSYEIAKDEPILRKTLTGVVYRESFNLPLMFKDLTERLENNPTDIDFSGNSFEFLGGGLFIGLIWWLHVVTSRKKLIPGKEYGTSKWATISEIKHLFAKNILAKGIGQLKKIFRIKKFKTILEYKDGSRIRDKLKAVFDFKDGSKIRDRLRSVFDFKDGSKSRNELKTQFDNKKLSLENKYNNADMLLTKTERICLFNYELNNNTLIIGGSGAGKTRGYAMPNILQGHSSYIITDPKGEILKKSGYFLKKSGYKIRVLNLDEKYLSDGYNPFHYINKERADYEERVITLIDTIILNTNGGDNKSSGDPFWDKAEKLFLQSIFFAVVESFPKKEMNINSVMKLISWLQIKEDKDDYNSELDNFFKAFEERYGKEHIAVEQYNEFRQKASGKTAKSIVISTVARLAPFKIKEIKRICSYDEMKLDMVGEEKTAIFVIVPPVSSTFNFISGMLFTQLFQELNYCATTLHKNEGQRLPVPCRFILDEFANTCIIPNFVKIIAYARSLNIGISIIIQSLEQLKKIYKDEWGVIVDNCNTLLYLGSVTHIETLEYMSKLLGKGTFDKKTTGRSKGKQSSTSTNFDKIGRELLDPSEIRKLPKKNCLLLVGGKNPFYSVKYNYESHDNYKFTSDKDPEKVYRAKIQIDKREDEPEKEKKEETKAEKKAIVIETEQEKIVGHLNRTILNSDFDDTEINDGEEFDYEESEDIEVVSLEKHKQVISVDTSIINLVQFTTSLVSIEKEEPQSIDFDDIAVNDGEEEETDEELIDTEIESIDELRVDTDELLSEIEKELGT